MATRKKPETGYYVATTTGVVRVKGQLYRYTRGKTFIRSTDPLLRAVPGSFEPWDVQGPEVVAL